MTKTTEAKHTAAIPTDQASLEGRSAIPMGVTGTLMENILPATPADRDIFTTEDPDVDFDPASMLPPPGGGSGGLLGAKLKEALADLDQIILAAEEEASGGGGQGVQSSEIERKARSRMMMKFVLQVSSKQKFVYEAELRHTTFYQNRLTYKFIMPIKDAVRLNSIYYRTTANVNVKTQNYGVRLKDIMVTTKWSDGRPDDPVDWPLKLSRKSKTGTFRVAGVEIKKSSRLKPEDVITVITFSFNGW